jgi:hypothetical protein
LEHTSVLKILIGCCLRESKTPPCPSNNLTCSSHHKKKNPCNNTHFGRESTKDPLYKQRQAVFQQQIDGRARGEKCNLWNNKIIDAAWKALTH